MALQYLEALKSLAASNSTKWIVPMELSELSRPIGDAMRAARDAARASSEGPADLRLSGMARHGSTRRSLAAWLGRIVAAGAAGYLGYRHRRGLAPDRAPAAQAGGADGGGGAGARRRTSAWPTRTCVSRPMTATPWMAG